MVIGGNWKKNWSRKKNEIKEKCWNYDRVCFGGRRRIASSQKKYWGKKDPLIVLFDRSGQLVCSRASAVAEWTLPDLPTVPIVKTDWWVNQLSYRCAGLSWADDSNHLNLAENKKEKKRLSVVSVFCAKTKTFDVFCVRTARRFRFTNIYSRGCWNG